METVTKPKWMRWAGHVVRAKDMLGLIANCFNGILWIGNDDVPFVAIFVHLSVSLVPSVLQTVRQIRRGHLEDFKNSQKLKSY